jgi:fructokinase
MSHPGNLTLPPGDDVQSPGPIVVVGEVLWDIFAESRRLGGAPLNFAVHAKRLGHCPILISALGRDDLGNTAAKEISELGLSLEMVNRSANHATGTASVSIDGDGHPSYRIPRPAAYDEIALNAPELRRLSQLAPGWLYYGTLFASITNGMNTLQRLFAALSDASLFYDINLRAGFQSMDVVSRLIAKANVVKFNEDEAQAIGAHFGLSRDLEAFCSEGARRFGWRAAAVTLGERGCVVWNHGDFAQAEGRNVEVADTVGAGDAFSAAFLHGLALRWPVGEIANFANRVGALVASRPGAIPDWTLAEAAAL